MISKAIAFYSSWVAINILLCCLMLANGAQLWLMCWEGMSLGVSIMSLAHTLKEREVGR